MYNHPPPIGGLLVSDFDGTITQYDFYDLVCQAFPEIAGDYWHQYERGEITHFEALRRIFAGIRTEESALLDIINRMVIEPHLKESVEKLQQCRWQVVIASAGCDWYIHRLLHPLNVAIPVYSNPGEFYPSQGLLMRLPTDSPFFSQELGINKVAIVRDALSKYPAVAYAGDGRPDLAPALLVPPHRRFAKSWLARKLTEIDEGFIPFNRWADVAHQLTLEAASVRDP